MADSRWVELAELDDIPADRPRTIKLDGHQLAVFRVGDQVHAIDNRCPHEGYPLASGQLSGGVLTCEWHNWKFELCSGRCVLGGEDVRAYPLRREGDRLLIDLAPPEGEVERLFASLNDAFDEADFGWAARVIERLGAAGVEPLAILDAAVAHVAPRLPYGYDHGLAVTADLAARLDGTGGDGELVLEACQAMVLPNLRRPPLEAPEPIAGAGEAELRAAIEGEDTGAAAAMVAGALAAGRPVAEVGGWLARAAGDHFLDYGHGEIYAVKATELAAKLGAAGAVGLMIALARALSLGTREDRLPYMRQFASEFARHRGRLSDWAAGPGDADVDDAALIDAVVDGALSEALDQVAAALDAGVAPPRIGLALSIAAGHRLARFDRRLADDPEVGHGWLDITHLLTHADAATEINRRWPGAAALRSLFYSARFIQHAAPLDHPEPPRLDPVASPGALWAAAFSGGATPIFFAHRIKTTAAALRTRDAIAADRQLGARPDADIAPRAVVRYLAAPIDERRTRARTTAARRFVHQGQRLTTRLGY